MTDPLAAPETSQTVFLSVGGNIGDALENCRQGVALLAALDGVALQATSAFYRTAPVDYEDQDWFVNAAVQIETWRAPLDLLDCLQDIQHQMGRAKDKIRFGPRILDLDIIFYGNLVADTPDLIVPHPRMHQRRFVLQPLCDINPDLRHPVSGLSVAALLKQLPVDTQEMERLTRKWSP